MSVNIHLSKVEIQIEFCTLLKTFYFLSGKLFDQEVNNVNKHLKNTYEVIKQLENIE